MRWGYVPYRRDRFVLDDLRGRRISNPLRRVGATPDSRNFLTPLLPVRRTDRRDHRNSNNHWRTEQSQMKMHGRKMRRERTHYSDYDLASLPATGIASSAASPANATNSPP